MVVQAKNTTARRSTLSLSSTPQEELKASELFHFYLRTFTLRSFPMNSISSILKPVLVFVILFGTSLFSIYCLDSLLEKRLDLLTIILRTVGVLTLCVAYGVGVGVYLQWLLSKANDTSTGSYIYACLLSLIFSPFFIFLSLRFKDASFLWGILNAILSQFILHINLTQGHTFVDTRANFIYRFIETAIVFIFLLWILPKLSTK